MTQKTLEKLVQQLIDQRLAEFRPRYAPIAWIAKHYFIGRTELYEALARGDIEGFVRRDDASRARGKRYIVTASVEAYLERQAATAAQPKKAA